MDKYCEILFVILVIFHLSSTNARPSLYDMMYKNAKETNQLVNAPTLHSVKENNIYHSIRKRDAFDDLLDLDVERDMEIYRDMLVGELTGADKTLLDRKLDEAENMSWKHRSSYHRYAIQIFDEVKRFHSIRSNVSDYNV